jgi:hypothetical protein
MDVSASLRTVSIFSEGFTLVEYPSEILNGISPEPTAPLIFSIREIISCVPFPSVFGRRITNSSPPHLASISSDLQDFFNIFERPLRRSSPFL